MKKNLARAFVLCFALAVTITACGKKASTPDELNESVIEYTDKLNDNEKLSEAEYENTSNGERANEAAEDTTPDNSDGEEKKIGTDVATEAADQKAGEESDSTDEDLKTVEGNAANGIDQNSAQNISISTQANGEPIYAISEDTETYIDMFGIQTIEKKYVIPYYADIRDIAPALITTNNVQYGIDSIVNPLSYEEKKVVKEIIAETEEDAKKFDVEFEYDGTDGKGVLTLDANSVTVELNKDEKIPSGVSVVRTYDMTVKDQDKVPQTVKSNGITYYQSKVTWTNMGDPGTGISGTEGNSGYGTYNTVASSWRATVTYSGTLYTEDKDYKGTATYVGKILMKNSPTKIYVVTYKPNTMVSNASGIYYNNYLNSMYSKENSKLAATGSDGYMSMCSSGNMGKVPAIIALLPWALLYLVAIGVAYVAFKVWKRVNEDPEEVVATTVTEGDISLDIDGEQSDDSRI